jgi:hypothetical protein
MSRTAISPRLRRRVAENSRYRCCYCLTQERIIGTLFTVDHIIPESLNGANTLDNLCLACWECNLKKNDRITGFDPQTGLEVRLFNPNLQKWAEHFIWQDDGLFLAGLTSIGRATVETLQLNRPHLVNARQLWIGVGWHPPQD